MAKPELEFFDPSNIPWRRPEGYPEGVWERTVAWDPERGVRSRFLRFDPGAETTETLVHDCWEEVHIISGGLIAGDQVFTQGMVAVRPPGMRHGPFKAPVGCVTFEVHYYSS